MEPFLSAWKAESRRLLALLEAAAVRPAAQNSGPIERALGALPAWLDTRDRLLAEFAETRARGLPLTEAQTREIQADEQALESALKQLRDALHTALQELDRGQNALAAYRRFAPECRGVRSTERSERASMHAGCRVRAIDRAERGSEPASGVPSEGDLCPNPAPGTRHSAPAAEPRYLDRTG